MKIWPFVFLLLFPAFVSATSKPNLIFIMADDLGWKDVGYAGAEFFETPNIDRLAKQGMRFEAAYSGGPNCAPTRACLMTGTYTPRHHIYQPSALSKGKVEYMKFLDSLKIPYEKLIVKDVPHSAQKIYEQKGLELMKFHVESFRQSGMLPDE